MQIRDGHIIEKLVVDVTTSSTKQGHSIKDNVRSFIDRCVVPAIEEYFASLETDLPEGQVLQINKLSLDISTRESDWDTAELEFAIKQEFGKALQQNRQELSAIQNNKDKASRKTETVNDRPENEESPQLNVFSTEQLQLDAWYHFLQSGMRPWWSAEAAVSPELQEERLLKLLSSNAVSVQQRLSAMMESAPVRKRMIYQFSDDFLPKAMILVSSGELPGTVTVTLNGETAGVDEWVARFRKQRISREVFWEMVLNYLVQFKKGANQPDNVVVSELFAKTTVSTGSATTDISQLIAGALKLLHVLTGKKEPDSYYNELKKILPRLRAEKDKPGKDDPEKDNLRRETFATDNPGKEPFEKSPGQSPEIVSKEPSLTESLTESVVSGEKAASKPEGQNLANQQQTAKRTTEQLSAEAQKAHDSDKKLSKEEQKAADKTKYEAAKEKETEMHSEKALASDQKDQQPVAGKEELRSDLKNEEEQNLLQQEQISDSSTETVPETTDTPETSETKESAEKLEETLRADKTKLSETGQLPEETMDSIPVSEQQNTVTYDQQEPTGMQLIVDNAGLVLVHPFLKHLFSHTGLLTEDNKLTDQVLAAHVLHYIATGRENDYEHTMLFEKYLAGIPMTESIPREVKISDAIKAQVDKLLDALKENWKPMKGSSHEAIRETFLQREGKLIDEFPQPRMMIERKTVDILLNQLNWTISIIRLPWMDKLIYVEW